MKLFLIILISALPLWAGAASAQQPGAGPRRDVLILRAIGLQEGALQGCAGESCTFNGQSQSRADILLIGLQVGADDAPPAIDDPFQDAIYLRNAHVMKSRLSGIDTRQVVTREGAHARPAVAWVFLALAPPTPSPRRPPPAAGRHTGALWTGQVQWTHKPFWGHLVTTSAELRLREKPLPVPPGTFVHGMVEYIELRHEGSQVERTHADILGGNNCTIRGRGSSSATGEVGHIQRTREEVGPNRQQRWTAWTYGFSVHPDREPRWTETCPQGSWTRGGEAGGWAANVGVGGDDPRNPRTLDGGRMLGAFVNRDGTFVSWSLCREGASC